MDPNAMHQALMNLLVNALQAVDPKTGRIVLRTKYLPARHEEKGGETKPARARISVIDNGRAYPKIRSTRSSMRSTRPRAFAGPASAWP
jgi:nitrogen-specific signal transduction histidine kinase